MARHNKPLNSSHYLVRNLRNDLEEYSGVLVGQNDSKFMFNLSDGQTISKGTSDIPVCCGDTYRIYISVWHTLYQFINASSENSEVKTARGLLLGGVTASTSGEEAVKAFRQYYPGKSEDVEQAVVIDWGRDPWAMACERIYDSRGELPKYWPKVIEPQGRIHFAGAYADNLSWRQEAATRSASRVAEAIDKV